MAVSKYLHPTVGGPGPIVEAVAFGSPLIFCSVIQLVFSFVIFYYILKNSHKKNAERLMVLDRMFKNSNSKNKKNEKV
jgi:hypothetical protein